MNLTVDLYLAFIVLYILLIGKKYHINMYPSVYRMGTGIFKIGSSANEE
jgi:hypothetical protein